MINDIFSYLFKLQPITHQSPHQLLVSIEKMQFLDLSLIFFKNYLAAKYASPYAYHGAYAHGAYAHPIGMCTIK